MKTQNEQKEKENKTGDKMIIRLKEETVNEILKNENNKEKKAKPYIFNNKKNNKECSNLLRLAINTEKELLVMPYPKEKQKKNKTLNEIGLANGISYPTTNIITGILSEKDNYKVIIRGEDENKYDSKNHKFSFSKFGYNTAEINL